MARPEPEPRASLAPLQRACPKAPLAYSSTLVSTQPPPPPETEPTGHVQTRVVVGARTPACCVCVHTNPLYCVGYWRQGGTGPLTFLSFTPSPRSPNTIGDGIREEGKTLALMAEPVSPKSEAGEKWLRTFR